MESAAGSHHSQSHSQSHSQPERVAAYLHGIMQSSDRRCEVWTENIWRDGLFLFSPVHVHPFTVLKLWLWLPSSDEPLQILVSTRYVEKLEVGFGLGAQISCMSTSEQQRWDAYYGQRRRLFQETSHDVIQPLPEGAKLLVMEHALSAPLVKLLRGKGIAVQCASDGNEQEVLSCAARGEIDLVIADMNAPQQEGLALCRTLRQSNPELPVMMMSSSGDEDALLTGADAGALHVVAKQCSGEILLSRIRNVLCEVQAARSTSQSMTTVQALNLEDSMTFETGELETLPHLGRSLLLRLGSWLLATCRLLRLVPAKPAPPLAN